MSFSEFKTLQKRSTDSLIQPEQSKFSIHNAGKNSETDPAQQKQRKQLYLTNDKNIFIYRSQPIQRLQLNFMTDGIRNFMYAKHNGDNAKLRIFSFIPQRQGIQPNFMNDSIRTFIHIKQPKIHTQRE